MLASPWAVGSWAIGTVVHCLGGGVHDRTIALRAAVVLVQKIQAELRLRSGAASIKSVSVRLRQLRAPVARRLLAISPDASEAAGTGKNQPDALRARVARLQRFHGFRQNTPESLGTSIETGGLQVPSSNDVHTRTASKLEGRTARVGGRPSARRAGVLTR